MFGKPFSKHSADVFRKTITFILLSSTIVIAGCNSSSSTDTSDSTTTESTDTTDTTGSTSSIVINEFMAGNDSTLVTDAGEYEDWIELKNTGSSSVELTGWCLTDDSEDLSQWCFESGTLASGGYMVVFASGDDVKTGSELHTNFKLGKDGEYLALTDASGDVVYEYADSYPVQFDDIAYGINSSGELVYFDTATPGAANIDDEADIAADADFVASDWTDETHSKDVDPNFDKVFDDTQVKRLDFVVTAEHWQSMLDDMTSIYGEFGRRSQGSGLIDSDEDPIFVPAEVYYNGTQWYRVGIRFKGNSSLQGAWQSGILKLSFKLDFDEFEDDYPQIDNQRFYGFKKFSLKNNYNDSSMLREKVAADVFKDAGVPVSHTAFYTLYVDHGNGPQYFGLYTLVEEVDGTVIDTQFSSDDGNLYKPEDGSANFVEGTFNADDFKKKTNEDDEDWSDIEALFAALHDDSRTNDPATWRSNLEAVFDVQGFLRYLAVNGIIQNWDTYGRMIHNYYLYNNPDNGKLTWIPWDNNEPLQTGKQGGALNLDFSNLTDSQWPLIAKIYADTEYKADYDAYLSEVIDGAFDTTTMQAKYETYKNMVESDATTEEDGYSFLNNASEFYSEVTTLKAHAASRATAVDNYLDD